MAYKDKQKERENKKKYYQEHREIILQRASAWNKLHAERRAVHRRNYYDKQQTKEVLIKNDGKKMGAPDGSET